MRDFRNSCYDRISCFSLFVALLFVYIKPIYYHPTLDFDDTALINPIRQVDSIQKYQDLIKENVILDVQPVRDATFWIELKIEKWTGFRNSQFVNVLIWFLAIINLFRILKFWGVAESRLYLIVGLVALHPTVTTSVAWTAARKHLLSVFFLSIFVYIWVSREKFVIKDKAKLLGSYFLLCFSQPINFLAPFLMSLSKLLVSRKKFLEELKSQKGIYIALSAIAVASAYVNLNYYNGDYVKQTGDILPKFLSDQNQKFIVRLFVWGRSFYQLINPFSPSPMPYKILKPETLIGVALLLIFVFIIWHYRRHFKKERLILALFLMASPLMVMTVRLTHHLGWDTYLLSTVWALGLFLASYERPLFSYENKIMGTLVIIFAVLSYQYSSKWVDNIGLYKWSYEQENSLFAQQLYAKELINRKLDWKLANELISDLDYKMPNHVQLPYMKARLVYEAPVSTEMKHKMFLDIESSHPWVQYYIAAFEVSNGHPEKANQRLTKLWEQSSAEVIKVMKENFPDYVSKWNKMCRLAKVENCDWINLGLAQKSQQNPNKDIESK